MIRVSFKATVDFEEEAWSKFKSQWAMPPALLHSTIKAVLMQGFESKYGIQPRSIGIFPLERKAKVEPENIQG